MPARCVERLQNVGRSAELVRQRRPRLPRPHLPPGRRHARHRRCGDRERDRRRRARSPAARAPSGAHIETLTVRNREQQPGVVHGLRTSGVAAGPNNAVPARRTHLRHLRRAGDGDLQPDVGVGARPRQRTVDVTITANAALPDRSLYGGYISADARRHGHADDRVPFAGFKGDYQSHGRAHADGERLPVARQAGRRELHQPAHRRDLHAWSATTSPTSCSTWTMSRGR